MANFATKLKIQMARDEEAEEEAAKIIKKVFICPYCKKEFSNGFEYGGHKRSHSMKTNKIQIKNSKKGVEDLVIDDDDENECPICDKKFRFKKSFYKHMKKHSEISSSSNVKSLDDEQIRSDVDVGKGFVRDLLEDLSGLGWSITGKRGRKGKNPSRTLQEKGSTATTTTDLEQEKMSSIDGASNLLALADSKPANERWLPFKKRKFNFSTLGDNKENNENGKGLAIIVSSEDEDEDNDDDGDNNNDDEVNLRTQLTTSREYICNICDRSFKTYQALGGHRAHHTRKLYHINSSPSMDDQSSDDEDDDLLDLPDEHPLMTTTTPPYQCPFCSKKFRKGQALGGHKRHCKARIQVKSKKIIRQSLDFDLNQPPPEENEEEKEFQDSISLGWLEDGAEHSSYSSYTPLFK